MKLRTQGNSLRLRVSRSDLARFASTGHLEETLYFGSASGCELTYELHRKDVGVNVEVESVPGRVRVLLPPDVVQLWLSTEQVGLTGVVDLGHRGELSILVEKDFACLDRSTEENADTFPHPSGAERC